MKLHLFLTIFLMSSTACHLQSPYEGESFNDKRIVCNYQPWSILKLDDIDPFLCTHIVYLHYKAKDDFRSQDPLRDIEKGPKVKFDKMLERNPQLKFLLGIGMWYEDDRYPLATVVKNAVIYLKSYGYHGLNIFQYLGTNCEMKSYSLKLLKDLKAAFEPEGLILAATAYAQKKDIDKCYDVPEMVKHLDFISVMTFDYQGPEMWRIKSFAPLYANPSDMEWQSTSNVNFSINYWIEKGCPPRKLDLGIHTYVVVLGYDVDDAGDKSASFLWKYRWEVCSLREEGNWTMERDPYHKTIYALRGDKAMAYDDEASAIEKIKFANQLRLGGIFIKDLTGDDFSPTCSEQKFPIINAVRKAVRERTVNSTQASYKNALQNSGSRFHSQPSFFGWLSLQEIFRWWLPGM